MLGSRRVGHDRVAASLAARDDQALGALLRTTDPATDAVGVGGAASTIEVDGTKVFAKRIPLTRREQAQPHSTANLFDLPTSCHYGMHPLASPGFGAWRELAAIRSSPTVCWPVEPTALPYSTTGACSPDAHPSQQNMPTSTRWSRNSAGTRRCARA